MHVDLYWPKWQIQRSKLAPKHFEPSEFHQDTRNSYLILGFDSAHVPWNAILNLDLQRSYKALRDDLVLLSATTLSKICRRDYALTVDAIKKNSPSCNKVSSDLDGGTSQNKLAMTLVIAYYIGRHWALREVQPAIDKVDRLFFSRFES